MISEQAIAINSDGGSIQSQFSVSCIQKKQKWNPQTVSLKLLINNEKIIIKN